MTAINVRHDTTEISGESVQLYIIQMLEELSLMAKSSSLEEIASLLKATSVAARVDVHSEIDP